MGSDACGKIEPLLMGAVDGNLNARDKKIIDKHLEVCAACREDLAAYEKMAFELSLSPVVIAAPDGFIEGVMLKIAALPEQERLKPRSLDSVIAAICGVFSVVFGIGFLLFLNRADIMAAMAANPHFAAYAEVMAPLEGAVAAAVGSVSAFFSSAFDVAAGAVSSYRYVIIVAFAVLSIAQFAIRSPKTAGVAYADEKAPEDGVDEE